ncbi:MAG: hypothetical protein HYW90_03405 [Candidatus Sungbacteria bacterium]|nr:hypothetical protein [Candidatus Sungbacteria bacterium]
MNADIYTTELDLEETKKAETFEELLAVALRIINRLSYPIGMVCGPITSGGTGSQEENVAKLARAIRALREEQGEIIFNQLVFEAAMMRIKETPYYRDALHLLEAFYRPLFEHGKIKTFYFVTGWKSSFGTNWEHEEAVRLGIKIVYLPEI